MTVVSMDYASILTSGHSSTGTGIWAGIGARTNPDLVAVAKELHALLAELEALLARYGRDPDLVTI